QSDRNKNSTERKLPGKKKNKSYACEFFMEEYLGERGSNKLDNLSNIPDSTSKSGSPCSPRGLSPDIHDVDIHTWSTNTTDYEGGASCSSSSFARRASLHGLGYHLSSDTIPPPFINDSVD
ncbi:hypothetical protein SK128_008775, partial [Halocaridina rubra]